MSISEKEEFRSLKNLNLADDIHTEEYMYTDAIELLVGNDYYLDIV
jgi:hypothetical protein